MDNNEEYANRFKFYLEKKYSLEITVLMDEKEAVDAAQQKLFDVVLFDSAFENIDVDPDGNMLGGAAFAYISETNETVGNIDTIFKYQSVTELYRIICGYYEKKKNRVVKIEKKNDKKAEKSVEIITFLPVHGGAGSSTMAAACAVALSETAPVLYLNLEQIPSDFAFFNTNEENKRKTLSNIVSLMKTKYLTKGLINELKETICKESKFGRENLYYIKGLKNIMDVEDLSGTIVSDMLRKIKDYLEFRYIIVDADFVVGKMLSKLIYSSDKLVFVSSDSDISFEKIKKIKRYLDILHRNNDETIPDGEIILNQYYGNAEALAHTGGMNLIGGFPRYRTNDNSRITSENIITNILSAKNVFDILK